VPVDLRPTVFPVDYQENFLRQIFDIIAVGDGMLEAAAKYVIALGYDPKTDCLLEIQKPMAHRLYEPNRERKRLLVQGKPFFEVVTTSDHNESRLVINFTVTPKMLNWDLRAKENPAAGQGNGVG